MFIETSWGPRKSVGGPPPDGAKLEDASWQLLTCILFHHASASHRRSSAFKRPFPRQKLVDFGIYSWQKMLLLSFQTNQEALRDFCHELLTPLRRKPLSKSKPCSLLHHHYLPTSICEHESTVTTHKPHHTEASWCKRVPTFLIIKKNKKHTQIWWKH